MINIIYKIKHKYIYIIYYILYLYIYIYINLILFVLCLTNIVNIKNFNREFLRCNRNNAEFRYLGHILHQLQVIQKNLDLKAIAIVYQIYYSAVGGIVDKGFREFLYLLQK